jgi:hypothetical protein
LGTHGNGILRLNFFEYERYKEEQCAKY